MRLFIAFDIPETVRTYAAELQGFFRVHGVQGKWCCPDNLHLTVLFLDEQDPDTLPALTDSLQQTMSAHAPFTFHLGGVSSFRSRARVLFMAWEDDPAGTFAVVSRSVTNAVRRTGITLPERVLKRSANPHVTLVRFRHPREARPLRDLGKFHEGVWNWHNLPTPMSAARTWQVTGMRIYSSVLHPTGPEYAVVAECPFDG